MQSHISSTAQSRLLRNRNIAAYLFVVAAIICMTMAHILDVSFMESKRQIFEGKRHLLQDGFSTQINYISRLIQAEGLTVLFKIDPLYFVHFIRTLVVTPFLWLEGVVGPAGPIFLLSSLLFPLYQAFRINVFSTTLLAELLRISAVFAPLFLSGRTILVTLGAGYLILGYLRPTRWRVVYVVVGVLCMSLSSGALLILMLFSLAALMSRRPEWQRKPLILFGSALILTLILPSFASKIFGFSTGADGFVLDESVYVEQPEENISVSTDRKDVPNSSIALDPSRHQSDERPFNQSREGLSSLEIREDNQIQRNQDEDARALPQTQYHEYSETIRDNPDTQVVSFLQLLGITPDDSHTGKLLSFADRVLSRSTLYVSAIGGQTARFVLYIGMLAASMAFLAFGYFSNRISVMSLPLAVLTLGFLLEGLSAWVILWPLIWAYTNLLGPACDSPEKL